MVFMYTYICLNKRVDQWYRGRSTTRLRVAAPAVGLLGQLVVRRCGTNGRVGDQVVHRAPGIAHLGREAILQALADRMQQRLPCTAAV